MTIQELLANPPILHQTAEGDAMQMGIGGDVLLYLHEHLSSGDRTIETGAGLSTIAFALKRTQHTAITPNSKERDAILHFCKANHIDISQIQFKIAGSENALPLTEGHVTFDAAIIDGHHGFPMPFVDYFYVARLLKVGGLLVIDDTWLWPCRALVDVLSAEPEWQLAADFAPRSAIFKKLAVGCEARNWESQPFVLQHSQIPQAKPDPPRPILMLQRGLQHIQRGEWGELRRKLQRKPQS